MIVDAGRGLRSSVGLHSRTVGADLRSCSCRATCHGYTRAAARGGLVRDVAGPCSAGHLPGILARSSSTASVDAGRLAPRAQLQRGGVDAGQRPASDCKHVGGRSAVSGMRLGRPVCLCSAGHLPGSSRAAARDAIDAGQRPAVQRCTHPRAAPRCGLRQSVKAALPLGGALTPQPALRAGGWAGRARPSDEARPARPSSPRRRDRGGPGRSSARRPARA